jgi:hypothetical protein
LSAERVLPGTTDAQRTVHFTGSVLLTRQPPAAERDDTEVTDAAAALAPDQVYRLFFHGPAYRVVGRAWRDGAGAAAAFAADLPPAADESVLAGPRLVELCFQAAGLWEAGRAGRLALPLHVDAVRFTDTQPAERSDLLAIVRPSGDGAVDCVVRDRDGRVVLRVLGYRSVALPDPVADDVVAAVRSVLSD